MMDRARMDKMSMEAEKRDSELYKTDGFEAEFKTKAQIALVKHLYGRIEFWRDTATVYKEAIEVMFFLTDMLRREP